MKALRVVAVAVVVIMLFSIASLVVVNLGDPELEPKLKALLEKPYTVPPEAVAAYKYLLAIGVAEGQDPATVGESWYTRLRENLNRTAETKQLEFNSSELTALKFVGLEGDKGRPIICPDTGSYCSKKSDPESRERIRALATRNHVLLERFEKLLDFPGYGHGPDLEPSMTAPPVRANDLLKIASLKLATVGTLIHEGELAQARAELLRVHGFFASSLEHPAMLVETLVQLSVLGQTRAFIEEANKENPDLLAKAPAGFRESFQVKIPFSKIADHMKLTELQLMRELFTWNYDLAFMFKANLGASEGTLTKSIGDTLSSLPVSGVFLKKNETLNEAYENFTALANAPCVTSGKDCEELKPERPRWRPLRNPIGRGLLQAMGGDSTGNPFKGAYRNYERLTEPL